LSEKARPPALTSPPSPLFEVVSAFLRLGLTSFGGPVAHLGYFHREFVVRRRWLSDEQFAGLLAICQFLPGPASSQLGFSLGMLRAGWRGGLAAFVAFTLPSAMIMVLFALLLPVLASSPGDAVIRGLKMVACVVVADALVSLSRKLCTCIQTRLIALAAMAAALLLTGVAVQMAILLVAALAGMACIAPGSGAAMSVGWSGGPSARQGKALLCAFALLLALTPWLSNADSDLLRVAQAFYTSGALVFGGGHVVLPLLQEAVVAPGWLSEEDFLAGYGAAQAIPGPMFALSAYLGAAMAPDKALLFAVTALVAIFLPGLLLVSGVLPFWHRLSSQPRAAAAIAGTNAAVVGLLAAALINPVIISGVGNLYEGAVVLALFVLLNRAQWSVLAVIPLCVLAALVPVWVQ